MTKEVLVSIKGLHRVSDGEDEEIETCAAGSYYFRNGRHYALYEEIDQENGTVQKSRIALRGKHLEICREGALKGRLVFEENHRTEGWYDTPAGSILAGFDVKDLQVTEEKDLIQISVSYRLELNEIPVDESRICIRITPKKQGSDD